MSERNPDGISNLAAYSALSHRSRLKIMDYLQRNPDATFEQMLENFELNPNSLAFHLRTLMEAGFLKTKPIYSVTEHGSKRFDELMERASEKMRQKETAKLTRTERIRLPRDMENILDTYNPMVQNGIDDLLKRYR